MKDDKNAADRPCKLERINSVLISVCKVYTDCGDRGAV